jgi:hypothetical protein
MMKGELADVLRHATREHKKGITGCLEMLKIDDIPEEGLLFEGVLLRCLKHQQQRKSTVKFRV